MQIKISAGSGCQLVGQLGVDLSGLTNPVTFVFGPDGAVAGSDAGFVIDLTGGGGQQRTATIVNAAAGTVQYTLTGADTAVPGIYRGQFVYTDNTGMQQIFPATGWIRFEVLEFVAPQAFSNLVDFYEPVRAIVGDFRRPWRFEDLALAGTVRSVIRMGLVPPYQMAPTGLQVLPAVTRPLDLARIVYHTAKILVGPQVLERRWGSRAMQVRSGEQRHFWLELQSLCYYADNPEQVCSFQSYYAWVNSLAGINVWGLMTQMRVEAPVATATISTAGITINTT